MTTISLTPKDLDIIVDEVLLGFVGTTMEHLRCICNKKFHKNCPKHNFQQMAKMVFDQRQPIGDKILHSQSKKIIMPVNGR